MVEQPLFQVEDGGSNPTSPLQLFCRPVNKLTAKNFYKKWHYLGDQGFLSTVNYGAYFDGYIVGVITFAGVSAVETIKGIFGTSEQKGFWEIKRLAMTDGCPKNSESRFIAVSIRLLRKAYLTKAIITYADTAQGHEGTIYKASGFKYLGLTDEKKDFVVNGKIQQRGKTKGVKGEWVDRSRKHKFVKEWRND